MRPASRLAAIAVTVAAVVPGVAACGDDDDTADLSYCDALAALGDEGPAIGPEADAGASAAALDLWEQVARTAPPDSEEAARVLADAAAVVAEDGSDAELDQVGVAEATATLASSAADTCGVDLMSDSDS